MSDHAAEVRRVWAEFAGIDHEGLEREIEARAAQFKAELELLLRMTADTAPSDEAA